MTLRKHISFESYPSHNPLQDVKASYKGLNLDDATSYIVSWSLVYQLVLKKGTTALLEWISGLYVEICPRHPFFGTCGPLVGHTRKPERETLEPWLSQRSQHF